MAESSESLSESPPAGQWAKKHRFFKTVQELRQQLIAPYLSKPRNNVRWSRGKVYRNNNHKKFHKIDATEAQLATLPVLLTPSFLTGDVPAEVAALCAR